MEKRGLVWGIKDIWAGNNGDCGNGIKGICVGNTEY